VRRAVRCVFWTWYYFTVFYLCVSVQSNVACFVFSTFFPLLSFVSMYSVKILDFVPDLISQ
jgi:hypothetical protein